MADVTPEQRAEWRKDAEKHAPGSDPKRDRILSLLDALEATEQELRQRELHHFETEQMLADAEARVAAAERREGCGVCLACDPPSDRRFSRMYLCATCGNKRCPAAADCRKWECSGSNEPGQTPTPRMGGER